MSALLFSIIQTQLVWENKAANLKHIAQKISEIKATNIIVLPEMFSTGFTMQPQQFAEPMDGETMKWMKHHARQKKCIITGSIIIKEDDNFYNRLIWMLPNGNYGHYDKRHLFAFAGEHNNYNAGNKRLIVSVNGWKINLQVCYDLRFPVWARQTPNIDEEPEYDVLINVANWPKQRIHAWRTLLQARAIENQAYVIGVNRIGTDANNNNYNGNSLVIDALGNIVEEGLNEEKTISVTLEKESLQKIRRSFPFLKDADRFNIIN